MRTSITISYRRQIAARAGTRRFRLAGHIRALPDGHPDKRVVAFMALYAREILRGDLPGPYSDERALTFARLALVDPDTFAAHRQLGDEQLATVLQLPLDQIPGVRRDHTRLRARSLRQGRESSQHCGEGAPTDAHTRRTGARAADMPAMATIQIIELHGRPVAVVAGDDAIIVTHITGADRARVKAKALYAIEIAAGTRPGPYTDAGAERYADTARALRSEAASSRPRAQRAQAAPWRWRPGRDRR